MSTCRQCYWFQGIGKCLKRPELAPWSFSPTCDKFYMVSYRWDIQTTTVPKSISYTTTSDLKEFRY